MLTDNQKSEIRRHLNYPAASRGHLPYPFGQTELFHYEQSASFLEQRLDLLLPMDEAKITGEIIGVLGFAGAQPTSGASFSLRITSADLASPGYINVGAITWATDDTLESMAGKLTLAINTNATLVSAGISAGGPFGPGLAGQNIPLPQVTIKAPTAFTLSFTAITAIGVVIQQQGVHVDPYMAGGASGGGCDPLAESSGDGTIYGYLSILSTLEALILSSSSRASFIRAGELVRGDELSERRRLYSMWCRKLADFLGVDYKSPSSGGGNRLLI